MKHASDEVIGFSLILLNVFFVTLNCCSLKKVGESNLITEYTESFTGFHDKVYSHYNVEKTSMCAYHAYQTRSVAISLIYVNEAVAIIDVLRFGLTSQWNVNIHQIARSS